MDLDWPATIALHEFIPNLVDFTTVPLAFAFKGCPAAIRCKSPFPVAAFMPVLHYLVRVLTCVRDSTDTRAAAVGAVAIAIFTRILLRITRRYVGTTEQAVKLSRDQSF